MNSVRYLSRRLFGSLALSTTLATTLGLTTALGVIGTSAAQETIKIGLIVPMTGPSASTGRQQEAAAKLFIQQNGSTVAGKKIELIVKDDTAHRIQPNASPKN
jgi:branched-chain amino acid transport system substrate-binding protein